MIKLRKEFFAQQKQINPTPFKILKLGKYGMLNLELVSPEELSSLGFPLFWYGGC